MPEIIKAVDNLVDNLLQADFKDLNLKAKVNEQVKIINERLKPKQKDLSNLLNNIVEKETKLARKISRVGIEDIIMNYESSSRMDTDSNLETEGNKKPRGSFRESRLVVQELVDNSEYLRKRQEELEDIKKISTQVKEITQVMASEVTNQAVGLKSIEDSVTQANLNVHKAEFEIEQAEKITRGGGKKICCLLWLIIFLVTSIIAIVLVIFLGKSG
jgi:methyl-accepting chemotaxis protein